MSTIVALATQQLAAYNDSNLDAFVACYHADVRVLNGDEVTIRGQADFRAQYQNLFESWAFGAEVPERIHYAAHCVDLERWWRTDPESGLRSEGVVLVRYEERDGLIGTVQFLR